MAENVLTRKVGPLPGWQWVALVGGGAGVLLYLVRARKAAAANKAASGGADLSAFADGQGPLPGAGAVIPIIIQQGGASTPAPSPGVPGAAYVTTSKVPGPSRQFGLAGVSPDHLGAVLTQWGFLTHRNGRYYTTKKLSGKPGREFSPNAPANDVYALLLKSGAITPVHVNTATG